MSRHQAADELPARPACAVGAILPKHLDVLLRGALVRLRGALVNLQTECVSCVRTWMYFSAVRWHRMT